MPQAGRVWEDFSYVASSSCRERVLNSLAAKPKFPSRLGLHAPAVPWPT